ncbi:uncharacterized protein LOC143362998 [Halictus rubicundus]|uniref:uncharacterized protein LOC143362998 n=1 Tax=Halictus rubicundus TaxID=77578 RepID=UPI004035B508
MDRRPRRTGFHARHSTASRKRERETAEESSRTRTSSVPAQSAGGGCRRPGLRIAQTSRRNGDDNDNDNDDDDEDGYDDSFLVECPGAGCVASPSRPSVRAAKNNGRLNSIVLCGSSAENPRKVVMKLAVSDKIPLSGAKNTAHLFVRSLYTHVVHRRPRECLIVVVGQEKTLLRLEWSETVWDPSHKRRVIKVRKDNDCCATPKEIRLSSATEINGGKRAVVARPKMECEHCRGTRRKIRGKRRPEA